MRLTKQLKAQVNSIKFASQIATTTEFMSNHHPSPNKETLPSDIPSAVLTSINTEETKQPLLLPAPKPVFPDPMNKFDNHHQRKLPTIITTSQSDSYLNHDRKRLTIKQYNYIADADDDDSLNSNIFHDEQIML